MPKLHLIVALASLMVLGACAGPNAAVKRDAATASANKNEPSCLTETGSRVPGSASCAASGHSYSSDDISRTGATTAAGSLRLLDPSITVH
jgi:hypothetical protein